MISFFRSFRFAALIALICSMALVDGRILLGAESLEIKPEVVPKLKKTEPTIHEFEHKLKELEQKAEESEAKPKDMESHQKRSGNGCRRTAMPASQSASGQQTGGKRPVVYRSDVNGQNQIRGSRREKINTLPDYHGQASAHGRFPTFFL